jgi:RNA polymerase sigma-70 factor (sigma-E family)
MGANAAKGAEAIKPTRSTMCTCVLAAPAVVLDPAAPRERSVPRAGDGRHVEVALVSVGVAWSRMLLATSQDVPNNVGDPARSEHRQVDRDLSDIGHLWPPLQSSNLEGIPASMATASRTEPGRHCNLVTNAVHLFNEHRVAGPAEGASRVASDVDAEFTSFAAATSSRLLGTAYLLCGDWHTAEDLTQTALAKVFVSWHRIRKKDAALAYARRTLLNTYLMERRGKRWREVLTSELPEVSADTPGPELRLDLADALAMLPARARAIVVLRYWEDMSVEQVAELVGCSTGNVKSQSARGLDKLRRLLGPTMAGVGLPVPASIEPQASGRDGYGRVITHRAV